MVNVGEEREKGEREGKELGEWRGEDVGIGEEVGEWKEDHEVWDELMVEHIRCYLKLNVIG